MEDLIKQITDKDNNFAYRKVKEIASISETSNQYYEYIDDFVSLLDEKSSYIRTRAFILICCQAKWDEKGKIKTMLPKMFVLFHDEKPTVVRQTLNAIKEVIVYRPELTKIILEEIDTIDLTKYKDSMSPLIKKDIDSLYELTNNKRF